MTSDPATAFSDLPRPVATGDDTDHSLTIEDVSELYARAGHPRTTRTLQRYAASGHLDARKITTTLGDKYLVTPQSVARHLAQIEELRAFDAAATSRDQPRPVMTTAQPSAVKPSQISPTATSADTSRPVATETGDMPRYVDRLEREVEQAKNERDFLREQIDRKDKMIEGLIERDRETNFLIRGLQDLIPRLAPPRGPDHDQHSNSEIRAQG